jgi:hypothetical protein
MLFYSNIVIGFSRKAAQHSLLITVFPLAFSR